MLLYKRHCHSVVSYMRGIFTWPFLKAVKQLLADTIKAIFTLQVSKVHRMCGV